MASTDAPARAIQLLANVPHWVVGRRASRSAADNRRALVCLAVAGGIAGVVVAWAVASSTVLVHPLGTGVLRGAVVASAVAVGCEAPRMRAGHTCRVSVPAAGHAVLSSDDDPALEHAPASCAAGVDRDS
jgi:hypothetical protein